MELVVEVERAVHMSDFHCGVSYVRTYVCEFLVSIL